MVYTLRGDIAVEENDLQSAADLYVKAIAASADVYTAENNTLKLALVYTAMGDAVKAQQTYKELFCRVITLYAPPTSTAVTLHG